jgi:hypothetical protein
MASASEAAIDIPVLLREQEARGCLTAHVTATRLQRRRLLLWSAHPKRIPTPVSQALLTSFISTQDHDHRRHAALERPPFARTVADLATVQQRARRLAVFTARSPPPLCAARSPRSLHRFRCRRTADPPGLPQQGRNEPESPSIRLSDRMAALVQPGRPSEKAAKRRTFTPLSGRKARLEIPRMGYCRWSPSRSLSRRFGHLFGGKKRSGAPEA